MDGSGDEIEVVLDPASGDMDHLDPASASVEHQEIVELLEQIIVNQQDSTQIIYILVLLLAGLFIGGLIGKGMAEKWN